MNASSASIAPYKKLEAALFDFIEAASDEFFPTVKKGEMDEAKEYFIEMTHNKVQSAYAIAMRRIYQGMDKDH